ncbi:MAG: hypothetical protein DRH56_04990 [Deltaproteobacteria bacterium]|nr:MAG: hypothetical protein DRH56_04990 [Deltaproteobacteria bacterium]
MVFAKSKDVLAERFGDRVLVFDLRKNLPYELNRSAAFVFMNTDGRTAPEAIARKFCREYDVDPDRALHDIRVLYEDLSRRGLVEPREGCP